MIAKTTQQVEILAVMLQNSRQNIVFTNGVFDILHAGHVTYLEQAKELGNILVVGLNSDESVRTLGKGPERPINTQDDRALVLQALRCVDHVMIFNESTPLHLISLLVPQILVKGGDYTVETVVGADIVQENGGEVVILPLLEGRSTTNIVNRAQKA